MEFIPSTTKSLNIRKILYALCIGLKIVTALNTGS